MDNNVFQFPSRKKEPKDSDAPNTSPQKGVGGVAKVFDLKTAQKNTVPITPASTPSDVDLPQPGEGFTKSLGDLLQSLLSPEGSLAGFAKHYESIVNKNSLAEQRAVVRRYSDEEILGFFKNTTEDDWKKKPAFYIALYHEKTSRGI